MKCELHGKKKLINSGLCINIYDLQDKMLNDTDYVSLHYILVPTGILQISTCCDAAVFTEIKRRSQIIQLRK